MDIEDIKVGMSCQVTAMGQRVFSVTEIDTSLLMPIGIGNPKEGKTLLFVRPIAIHRITLKGHTNN